MNVRDLVLAVVQGEPQQKMVGRTLLQKKVFFVNELLKGTIAFLPHYYGPYSREVASAVDSLVSAGLLTERPERFPEYDTPWGESTRYTYLLPDPVAKELPAILDKALGDDLARVEKALTKMNELPQAADYRTLSLAAKVFQIVKGKDKMQVGDFGKEARRLGWKLTSSDVTKAADLLKQLGLVKVTQERPTGGPPKQTQPAA